MSSEHDINLLVAFIAAVPIALLVSKWMQSWYGKLAQELMLRRSVPTFPTSKTSSAAVSPQWKSPVLRVAPSNESLDFMPEHARYSFARRRRQVLGLIAGGVVFNLVITYALLDIYAEEIEISARHYLAASLLMSWPVFATVKLAVDPAGKTGLLAALFFLAYTYVALWVALVIVVITERNPGSQFVTVYVGSAAAIFFAQVLSLYRNQALVVLLALLVMALLCCLASRVFGTLFMSGFDFKVNACWILVTTHFYVMVDAVGGVGAAAIYAFIAFQVIYLAASWVSVSPRNRQPESLLFLRDFSHKERTERLLMYLSSHWLHLGSVNVLIGPDLTSATIESQDVLDFVSGRLRRRLKQSASYISRAISKNLQVRSLAGQYRLNKFLCRESTWRPVFDQLASVSDVILLDLRGFCDQHRGCAYELTQIVKLVPLSRVVFAIDEFTDESLMRRLSSAAIREAADFSPNADGSEVSLTCVSFKTSSKKFKTSSKKEHRLLFYMLCDAADAANTKNAETVHPPPRFSDVPKN